MIRTLLFTLLIASTALAQKKPDDFELLPEAAKPVDREKAEKLQQELETRRTLLQLHQGTGLVLLGGMAATCVFGQLEYSDKYGGGGDTGKWHAAHQISAYGTAGLFATAGLLAVFAPSPLPRRPGIDTATLHKTFMAIATAGMVAQVVLGIVTAKSEGNIDQRDFALAHLFVGYATAAATATGFAVLTF
jgi:hypothetical protein